MELSEFDISFEQRTTIKSQVLADFIVESSVPTYGNAGPDTRWIVYVDGAASNRGAGAGVTMVGPKGETVNYALQLM